MNDDGSMLLQPYKKAQFPVPPRRYIVCRRRHTTVILKRALLINTRSHLTTTHTKSKITTKITTTTAIATTSRSSTGNCRIGDSSSSRTITSFRRILWKPLNTPSNYNKLGHLQEKLLSHSPPRPQQQFMIWIVLLFLLSQQHGSDCLPTNEGTHRAQRRFMWKQMDSTVDGFMGRVVSGARVMKGMIGEFIPRNHKQGSGNALDYLPTETTRVKYIIRNPHTKETKVIKMRPSKKVIKLMAMTPKPLMNEQKHKAVNMLQAGKLRQMEREQELIAEGKLPAKHEERPANLGKQMDSSKGHTREHSQNDNDIVSGVGVGGNDFGDTWKPVYKETEGHTSYPTSRPSMMSPLHTSIIGEPLPKPEKQVYKPLYQSETEYKEKDHEYSYEQYANKSHTYEVTEYAAEESVMQPLTHDYYSYRHVPVSGLSLKVVRHHGADEPEQETAPKEVVEEPPEKVYIQEYKTPKGAAPLRTIYRYNTELSTAAPTRISYRYNTEVSTVEPSRISYRYNTESSTVAPTRISYRYNTEASTVAPTRIIYRYNAEASTATPTRITYRYNTESSTTAATTTASSTTTTEEPNYPASFLKKMRERPDSLYQPKHQPRNKPKELVLENTWLPSNVSYATSTRNRPAVYHQTLTSIRVKSQKWPPDLEETHHSDSGHDEPATTDSPSPGLDDLEAHTTSPLLSSVRNTGTHSRKNVRLKTHHGTTAVAAASSSVASTASNSEYHRHRNVRQRGSIRFGDKLDPDEG